MTVVVNLSAIHTLKPISAAMGKFALLCDRYSASCCPGIFKHGTNKAWVGFKYYRNLRMINAYKLGQLTTEQFLNNLLDIFSFLKNDRLELRNDDVDRLRNKQDQLWSLKNKQSPTKRDYVLALLEEAWNEIIQYPDEDKQKFSKLVELAKKGEKIYFISNTNELNVYKILYFLRAHFPGVQFDPNIDISINGPENQPIQLAQNIYLCPSYRYKTYKTDLDNKGVPVTNTPTLLKALVTKEFKEHDLNEITVVSQFPKDLEEAVNIGVSSKNTHAAKDYYPSAQQNLGSLQFSQ